MTNGRTATSASWNQRLEKQMLQWTLGLVFAGGVFSSATLLTPPGSEVIAPTSTSPIGQTAQASDRAPASVLPPVLDTTVSMMDYQLGCQKSTKLIVSENVHQLRITSEFCQLKKSEKVLSSSVENKSNGFVATVFALDAQHFSTDYISLAKGQNHLVLQHQGANGASMQREVVIERAPATSKKKSK